AVHGFSAGLVSLLGAATGYARGTVAPLSSTTVVAGGPCGGCCALFSSLSVVAVPVLVAVATAAGAGFLAASPRAETILSLFCLRNSRSFSLSLRSAWRSSPSSARRALSAAFSASGPQDADACVMQVR